MVWAALILLLAVSVGATFVPIGPWRQVVSLGAAGVKAALILWFFMDLRRSPGLVRLAATGAAIFLAILFTLLSADYASRGWLGM
jgi:cytochrome c oxidase subunit IV